MPLVVSQVSNAAKSISLQHERKQSFVDHGSWKCHEMEIQLGWIFKWMIMTFVMQRLKQTSRSWLLNPSGVTWSFTWWSPADWDVILIPIPVTHNHFDHHSHNPHLFFLILFQFGFSKSYFVPFSIWILAEMYLDHDSWICPAAPLMVISCARLPRRFR